MTIQELHKFYKGCGFTGTIVRSENFAKVISEITGKEYNLPLNGKGGNKKLVILINMVKNDAKKYTARTGKKEINYFDFSLDNLQITDFRTKEFKGCKIDISAAYWNTAHRLFLSDKTYEFGIKNKPLRLSALGCLAIQKFTETWEDGKLKKTTSARSEYHEVYKDICEIVDKTLRDLFYVSGSVFGYFVDCVFMSTQNKHIINMVTEYFKKNSYDVKLEMCNFAFKIEKENIYLLSEKNGETKQYFVSKEL